jgi:hypothetical protein
MWNDRQAAAKNQSERGRDNEYTTHTRSLAAEQYIS